MEKKYEFTGQTKIVDWKLLHQIRAVRDFGDVKKGEIGGFIESQQNLSHEGRCWIRDDAFVYDNAYICEDAIISDSLIYENTCIGGITRIHSCCIYGDVQINGNTLVDDSTIMANAKISGCSCVCNAVIGLDADIKSSDDFINIQNIGGDTSLTFYKDNRDSIHVSMVVGIDNNDVNIARIEDFENMISFFEWGEYKSNLLMMTKDLAESQLLLRPEGEYRSEVISIDNHTGKFAQIYRR